MVNKKNIRHYKKQKFFLWLMILPVLLVRFLTTLYPCMMTVLYSFGDLSMLNREYHFVGFDNFVKIFSDARVRSSLEFTLIFTLISMILHIILGILLAQLLNIKFRGKRILRSTVLLPWAMPMAVVGLAAKWAFNDSYGLINDLIRRFINPDFNYNWLVHRVSARAAVISIDLWKDLPFFAILVLALLQFIPDDVYESARVDGANRIQGFTKITLPIIMPSVLTFSTFFTLWRLTSYEIVYTMTSGGPSGSTELLAYRIATEAFTNGNISYASAIAMILFFCMLLLAGLNICLAKKKDY